MPDFAMRRGNGAAIEKSYGHSDKRNSDRSRSSLAGNLAHAGKPKSAKQGCLRKRPPHHAMIDDIIFLNHTLPVAFIQSFIISNVLFQWIITPPKPSYSKWAPIVAGLCCTMVFGADRRRAGRDVPGTPAARPPRIRRRGALALALRTGRGRLGP